VVFLELFFIAVVLVACPALATWTYYLLNRHEVGPSYGFDREALAIVFPVGLLFVLLKVSGYSWDKVRQRAEKDRLDGLGEKRTGA
jgi:hypothetical protein